MTQIGHNFGSQSSSLYLIGSSVSHYGLKRFGPVDVLEAIQVEITSTSRSKSFDASARSILESAPKELPTSLATVSHGVPTVRFAKISPPRFTASAIAGGTSGRACKMDIKFNLHAPYPAPK